MQKKISIIIPAYNEEKRIGKTIEDYCEFFSKIYKNDFEIFVVLNGCRDNTLDIIKEYSKKYKQIKYKDIKEAIGKGGAIKEGFKLVNGELIGFVDADDATKSIAFYNLIQKIDNYDGIVASRWIKGAKINKKQTSSRRIGSRGFNILVRILFGLNINDTQCGAKLFKGKVIKKIVDELDVTNWAFDIDLLYVLKKKNYKIKEIPTEWNDVSDSKFNLKKQIKEMGLAITRLRLIYSPFRFIVKIYDKIFGNG